MRLQSIYELQLDGDSLSQYGNAAFRSASDQELINLIRQRVESHLPSTSVDLSDEYLKRVIEFLRVKVLSIFFFFYLNNIYIDRSSRKRHLHSCLNSQKDSILSSSRVPSRLRMWEHDPLI